MWRWACSRRGVDALVAASKAWRDVRLAACAPRKPRAWRLARAYGFAEDGRDDRILTTLCVVDESKRTYDVVDPGCLMLVTGECTCDPELCSCAECKIHKGNKGGAGRALKEAAAVAT